MNGVTMMLRYFLCWQGAARHPCRAMATSGNTVRAGKDRNSVIKPIENSP